MLHIKISITILGLLFISLCHKALAEDVYPTDIPSKILDSYEAIAEETYNNVRSLSRCSNADAFVFKIFWSTGHEENNSFILPDGTILGNNFRTDYGMISEEVDDLKFPNCIIILEG